MSATTGRRDRSRQPLAVALARRVENARVLDRLAPPLSAAAALLAGERTDDVLRGGPVGHALHPFLTDLPMGLWTSSLALDLRGRRGDQEAADLLLALGLGATFPAVLTGLAEWRSLGPRDARTGSLHAGLNALSTMLFAGSLASRAGDRRRLALGLSVLGTGVVSLSGFPGGHLAVARDVGSRDVEFEDHAPSS